jgi:hypothetical protein
MEVLALTIVKKYIEPWTSSLSSDTELEQTIQQQILSLSKTLDERLKRIDWVPLFALDLPVVFKWHIRVKREAMQRQGSLLGNGTVDELYLGALPHPSVNSEGEMAHLSSLMDMVLTEMLPPEMSNSDVIFLSLRHLLVHNLLLPLLDHASSPMFWYEFLEKVLCDAFIGS